MSGEPPPYRRCYLVVNEHADMHGRVGALVDILDASDDPDFRERRFVLEIDGMRVAYSKEELEYVAV